MSMLMACDVVSVVRLPSFVRRPDSLSDDVVFVLCGMYIPTHPFTNAMASMLGLMATL